MVGKKGTMATRLQISLNAKNLKNYAKGFGGFFRPKETSDPFAIVTVRGDDPDKNVPLVAGFTNVVYNCLDPTWSTVIIVEGYKFGKPYFIEVGIFDFDYKASSDEKKESTLAKAPLEKTNELIYKDIEANQKQRIKFPHTIMGSALFEVGEVLASRGSSCSKRLTVPTISSNKKNNKDDNNGIISIHIESSKENGTKGQFRLKLAGMDLSENYGNKSSSSNIGRNNNITSTHSATSIHTTSSRLTDRSNPLYSRTVNPFYELYRRVEKPTGDVTWNSVFRSGVIKHTIGPEWEDVVLDIEALCNGNIDRTLLIKVLSYKKSGKHKILGSCKTTVQELIDRQCNSGRGDYCFDLMSLNENESTSVAGIEMIRGSSLLMEGNIIVLKAEIIEPQREEETNVPMEISVPREKPTFVDYLNGDCQINLAVAIDFSAINGNPLESGSLHYIHEGEGKTKAVLNDYQKALYYVGKILAPFDHNQQFPVWGFGAKFHNNESNEIGTTNNCFQCGDNVEVNGLKGIMKAYKQIFNLPFIMSSDPTDITEVIQAGGTYAIQELNKAQENNNKLNYTILLIVTAGDIHNVVETKRMLQKVSKEPLSVVMVGIGNRTDFEVMEFLDDDDADDDTLLDPGIGSIEKQQGTTRDDIVQFVKFNDYITNNHPYNNKTMTKQQQQHALTEAVLEEIPEQLVEYFYTRGMFPSTKEEDEEDDLLSILSEDTPREEDEDGQQRTFFSI